MNEDGTATVVATADNIILSYGYVPGAEMNLAQLMHELKGMYQVTTTNTMLTVRSEQFDLTMYEFIVMGDVMSCVISEKERLQLQRQ